MERKDGRWGSLAMTKSLVWPSTPVSLNVPLELITVDSTFNSTVLSRRARSFRSFTNTGFHPVYGGGITCPLKDFIAKMAGISTR